MFDVGSGIATGIARPARRAAAVLAAALLTLAAGQAAAAGDPEAGQVKFETCKGCHAIEGYKNTYPTYSVPRLTGQKAEYIVLALQGYRSGERAHPTMRGQAGSMTDQDIEDLAAYIGSLSE